MSYAKTNVQMADRESSVLSADSYSESEVQAVSWDAWHCYGRDESESSSIESLVCTTSCLLSGLSNYISGFTETNNYQFGQSLWIQKDIWGGAPVSLCMTPQNPPGIIIHKIRFISAEVNIPSYAQRTL